MLVMQKFEVHVLEGPDAQVKTVTVLIDVSQKQGKTYRGGYKDKRDGRLYHHADCQTDRKVRDEHMLSSMHARAGWQFVSDIWASTTVQTNGLQSVQDHWRTGRLSCNAVQLCRNTSFSLFSGTHTWKVAARMTDLQCSRH